jgi:hypothetical protein
VSVSVVDFLIFGISARSYFLFGWKWSFRGCALISRTDGSGDLCKDEDLVPSIESFSERHDDLIPIPKFVRVDPLTYQADPLEFFLARLRNLMSLNRYPRTEGAEIYGEDRASGFACKRRRISP